MDEQYYLYCSLTPQSVCVCVCVCLYLGAIIAVVPFDDDDDEQQGPFFIFAIAFPSFLFFVWLQLFAPVWLILNGVFGPSFKHFLSA